jgi:hypothetical protein
MKIKKPKHQPEHLVASNRADMLSEKKAESRPPTALLNRQLKPGGGSPLLNIGDSRWLGRMIGA